jgi:hypothetical protein
MPAATPKIVKMTIRNLLRALAAMRRSMSVVLRLNRTWLPRRLAGFYTSHHEKFSNSHVAASFHFPGFLLGAHV